MIERRFRHTSTRGSVAPRRTSDRRFTGDCIHSSLLRRGATEPPDSHSPSLHVLHGQTSLRTLRPCASALKSTRSTRLKSKNPFRSTVSNGPFSPHLRHHSSSHPPASPPQPIPKAPSVPCHRWQALPNQDSSLQIKSAANLPRLSEDHLIQIT